MKLSAHRAGALTLPAPELFPANPAVAVPANPGETPDFRAIDQCLQQAVVRGTVADVVAMAATGDGIVYEGAYGRGDAAVGDAVHSGSVFWLLSLTKAFTATACMQQIERGRLHLDQDAGEILQELRSPQVLVGFRPDGTPTLRPARRPITVRHLLTHTSGYTYAIWSETLRRYQAETGTPDIASCQNGAFAAPLEFDPGERWEYGISLDWVGKLVEQVTNQSLEVYLRENIFSPLGMKDSGFLLNSAQRQRLAPFYRREPDGSLAPGSFELPQRPEFFMGGGGAFSTPRDYLSFLQMLLHGGEFRGARILQSETVARMMTNQIGELDVHEMRSVNADLSHSFDQFPHQRHKWGLSFDINLHRGPNGRSAGSISWAGLLNCYYWLDPTRQVIGALFTQMLPFFDPRVVELCGEVERCLYAALDRP